MLLPMLLPLLLLLAQVPAWRPDAFLANLTPAALPPVLSARLSGNSATAAAALYAAFIDSPNFAFWFQQRRAPVLHLVEDEVRELYVCTCMRVCVRVGCVGCVCMCSVSVA